MILGHMQVQADGGRPAAVLLAAQLQRRQQATGKRTLVPEHVVRRPSSMEVWLLLGKALHTREPRCTMMPTQQPGSSSSRQDQRGSNTYRSAPQVEPLVPRRCWPCGCAGVVAHRLASGVVQQVHGPSYALHTRQHGHTQLAARCSKRDPSTAAGVQRTGSTQTAIAS